MPPIQRCKLSLIAASVGLAFGVCSHAQIVTDGSLSPTGAATSLSGPNYAIGAGLGQKVGANLFHSFSTFNLAKGESATFSGPAGIANVISRVTGGSASSVDGLIRSTILGANLFLINPKGILFGPNASLDLTGSFYASSASYLRFSDGNQFDAIATPAPVLTAAAPEAFGFLGPAAGDIRVRRSALTMTPGAGLHLVGGKVKVKGATLTTQGGDLRISSVSGAGEVPLAPDAQIPAEVALGRIKLTKGATLAAHAAEGVNDPPGRILIRGGRLTVAGSSITSLNATSAAAGAIELIGRKIEVDAGAAITSGTSPGSTGAAADITLTGKKSVDIRGKDADDNFSRVSSSTAAAGSAGSVTLSAKTVTLDEGVVGTTTYDAGASGRVTISAKEVNLLNGSYVYADAEAGSTGKGGEVVIDAKTAVVLRGVDSFGGITQVSASAYGAGNAGQVVIKAHDIVVQGGAMIDARAHPDSTGNAGRIVLQGDASVSVQGVDASGVSFSTVAAGTTGAGSAGSIVIKSPHILLDQAIVDASSEGAGDGGHIRLKGTQVSALNGALITASARDTSTAAGGRVAIEATGLFELRGVDLNGTIASVSASTRDRDGGSVDIVADQVVADGAGIFAEVRGRGDSTGAVIRARTIDIVSGGGISTGTSAGSSGDAGDLTLIATESISVRGLDPRTQLASTVLSDSKGSGRAGNVSLNAPLIAIDDGRVGANSAGAGGAGRVQLAGRQIELHNGVISSAVLGSGAGGKIEVTASDSLTLRGDGNDGLGSAILGLSNDSGRGADIAIHADRVTLENGEIASRALSSGDAGSVAIVAGDLLLDRGGAIAASSERSGTGNGGSVSLAATRSIVVQGVSPLGLSSEISTSTTRSGRAGDLVMTAPLVRFDGGLAFSETSASGAAGNITLEVDRLEIVNGGQISANTLGDVGVAPFGRGGNIMVSATDTVLMRGFDADGFVSSMRSQTRTGAPGGNIAVSARSIQIDDSALVAASTSGSGAAGNVALSASDAIVLAARGSVSADTLFGTGAGGTVKLAAPLVRLAEEAVVRAGSTGSGAGGDIIVDARRVEIESGGQLRSAAEATGSAGRVTLRASESIVVRGTAADTGVSSGVRASTAGAGRGGDVLLSAPSVRIDKDGTVQAGTTGSGAGGNVRIEAQQLRIAGGGGVSASTEADGNAGGVTIVGRDLTIEDNDGYRGLVSSDTEGGGSAGNILIDLSGSARIDGSISAQTVDGPGRGGNIALKADSIELRNGGIAATTYGSGHAGQITLDARHIVIESVQATGTGVRSDTAGSGNAGGIAVNADALVLTNGGTISTVAYADTTGSAGAISINVEGPISLLGRDHLGYPSTIRSIGFGEGPGGTITLAARSLVLDEGIVSVQSRGAGHAGSLVLRVDDAAMLRGGRVDASIDGSGAGGQIDLRATHSLTVQGKEALGPFSEYVSAGTPSGVYSVTRGSGPGGNINVASAAIELRDTGQISASSSAAGAAGSIEVLATDALTLAGGAITTAAQQGGTGAAGNIRIQAGRLSLEAGEAVRSQIASSTEGPGAGGTIDIAADTVEMAGGIVTASTAGTGNAGVIAMRGTLLDLRSGQIASTTEGPGAAGGIAIEATQRAAIGASASLIARTESDGSGGSIAIKAPMVQVDGTVSADSTGSASSGHGGSVHIDGGLVGIAGNVSASTRNPGKAGSVTVVADQVLLSGGSVSAKTSGSGAGGSVSIEAREAIGIERGAIASDTAGAGAGGDIRLAAPRIAIAPGSVTASTSSSGAGGRIEVRGDSVSLGADARIAASSTGSGTAGSISVVATDALQVFGGAIATEAITSDGGNITIEAGNRVHLRNGQIITSVHSGQGSGGNIFIDPTFVILENSRIVANAFGGAGGNISIVSNYFLSSPDSVVDASSQLGLAGSVQIAAPQTDAISGLPALPAQFFDASGLLREACGGRWQPGSSRLVGVGRGGIAASPYGYAASTYFPQVSASSGAAAPATPIARSIGDDTSLQSSVLLAAVCGR